MTGSQLWRATSRTRQRWRIARAPNEWPKIRTPTWLGVLVQGWPAALIPGIGPFIVAGGLAHALGAVGGTAGAVAGALSKWGLDQADANYSGGEIERGATFVAVDLDGTGLTRNEVEDAFRRFHGRWAGA
jgi:hypothetical protein